MTVDNSQAATGFAIEWFENRLSEARNEVDILMSQFRLSEALKTIYSLVWDDFCSWYLEWVKPGFEQPIGAGVYTKTIEFFTGLVQLLHPFMPFITEELYHLLADRKDDLCVKQFQPAPQVSEPITQKGNLLKESITAIRDARNKAQLKPKEEIALHVQAGGGKRLSIHYRSHACQTGQCKIDCLHHRPGGKNHHRGKQAKTNSISNPEQAVDTGNQKEDLHKRAGIPEKASFLVSVEKKLGNERFVQNAKPEVVELEQKKKSDALAKVKVIEESLANL